MLANIDIQALLARLEDDTLDFKQTAYDLSKGHFRFALVKDILCMANTPRATDAHIVLGVKQFPNGSTQVVGLNHHVDEADMQAQFSDRVDPVPRFTYRLIHYQGKDLGIITIPPERVGPCVARKDYGNSLREKQVYFRRGSKNEIAGPEDIKRICNWISAGNAPHQSTQDIPPESLNWRRFVEATYDFSTDRTFILVSSIADAAKVPQLDMLGTVPWSFVLDLDPESEQSGLLNALRPAMEDRRNVHVVVRGNRPTLNLALGTYWFFARGLAGSQASILVNSWIEWQQQYGNELREQVSILAKAATPSPITVIAAWYGGHDTDYLQSVLEAFLSAMGGSVDFVIATHEPAEVQSVVARFNAQLISIPLHHICSGLKSRLALMSESPSEEVSLPSSSGAPITLETPDANWIAEEIELLHLALGRPSPQPTDTTRDFLRGNEITWSELSLRHDVERDQSRRLLQQAQRDLSGRRAVRINLYHEPGAGGTTVARRLLWDLHHDYPCAVLKRSEPRETIERLQRVVALTGQPTLLLADGGDVSSRDLDELFEYIAARHLPVVMIQVLRRYTSHQPTRSTSEQEGDRTIRLSSLLSPIECHRFANTLSLVTPTRKAALDRVAATQEHRLHTPFYYCLEAFGEDFLRLDSYVAARLDHLTSDQNTIMSFLALAHHYGQKPLPAQAFATTLGIPQNHTVDLPRAISERGLELVVETSSGEWRTAHDLIAIEVLKQLLWTSSTDRTQWRQHLSAHAIAFITFCRGRDPLPSETMLEVARRTFVYRDNVELLGTERSATTQFAQLIADIPVREGRLEVMRTLAAEYPDEAHFMAHLGRFYDKEMRDYEKAVSCVERALLLEPDNSSIHHMKGMALRSQASGMIERREPLSDVISVATRASESFALSREKSPDNEHGYISEVQLRSRLLDYAGAQHTGGLLSYISLPTADPFIRNSIDRSEDLLEQIRRNREGQGPSSYEQECRGRLDQLYGRHDQALQIWDSLLGRHDVYSPPIRRQIVWTYLARSGRDRSWDQVPPRELVRAKGLIEDNLDEEPNNDRDMRMWVQVVRRVPYPPSIESVIEKVSYWKANSDSIDATYYLYIFNAILALEGSILASEEAAQYLEECRNRSRLRRNRTRSFEWVGRGAGLARLVHQSRLGEWDRTSDFWMDVRPLSRVSGRISRIRGSEAGSIEVADGMSAFFVPAKGGFALGRSENQAVEFYLGFSYEGLRAWDVKPA